MDLPEDPHSNGSLGDERAFADDPFGMAAILREHADTGPMPELVARRISAALSEAERERSTQVQPIATAAGSAAAGRADHLHSVPTVSTASPQWQPGGARGSSGSSGSNPDKGKSGARSGRSRRASAWLGIAAATVVIAGGGALLHSLKGTPTATSGVAAQATPPTTERQTVDGRVSSQPTDLGMPAPGVGGAAGVVHLRISETNYHRVDLVAEATRLVDSNSGGNSAFTLPPNAAESPAVGPIATDLGMRSCVAGLGASNPKSVVADIANFEGQPAVIVVVIDQNGARTAYAAERSCSQSAPHLLASPVQLP